MKKRWPFLVVLAGIAVTWQGAFGLLASDRDLVWRLRVPFGEVRRLELQVWDGDSLLKRAEVATPGGLTEEPHLEVPLVRGGHRAVALAWLGDAGTPVSLRGDFDPGNEKTVVLDLAPGPGAGRR